jgi:hypothetical protein
MTPWRNYDAPHVHRVSTVRWGAGFGLLARRKASGSAKPDLRRTFLLVDVYVSTVTDSHRLKKTHFVGHVAVYLEAEV